MGKIATTWQLMKDSWGVLMRDKELMLFPIASGVATFLVLLTFILPFVGTALWGNGGTNETVYYVVLFCYYVCNFFVIVYFNAALVAHVVTRLRGGEPTIRQSLGAATACVPQIAAWALVSATVGVILRWLSDRAGFLGQIAIAIVGIAWTLVTYFVVPLIVIERKGAFDAIGDSKDLLRSTWGQQIVSGLGYGLIGFMMSLPGLVIIVGAIVAGVSMQSFAAFGALTAAALLYVIGVGIVMSTLRAIFGAVLYEYAKTGEAPAGFDAVVLRSAIRAA